MATPEDHLPSHGHQRPEIFLATFALDNRIGFACWSCLDGTIEVAECQDDDGLNGYPALQLFKLHKHPTIIYHSSKASDEFVRACKQAPDGETEPTVRVLKHSYFGLDQAFDRIMSLTSSTGKELDERERRYVLGSRINLDLKPQIRALGALLAVIQAEGGSISLHIESLQQQQAYKTLQVDFDAVRTLQIFESERHPSMMGIGNAKEGFSVYGVMNKCVSQQGAQMLRSWMLRPSSDMTAIQRRQELVAFFLDNSELASAIAGIIAGVKDVPRLLQRCLCPSIFSTNADWRLLSESTASLLQLGETLNRLRHEGTSLHTQVAPMLPSFPENLCRKLSWFCSLISSVLNLAGEQAGSLVADGVCPELDEMKQLHAELPDFLTEVVQSEIEHLSGPMLTAGCSARLVYVPQIGYLMRLDGTQAMLDGAPDVEFVFTGDNADGDGPASYYRTPRTTELDSALGDLHLKIIDLENSVILDLQTRLRKQEDLLRTAANIAAEMDCILALATCAHDYNLIRPVIVEDNVIRISQGRHLLQELVVDTFVPNDTNIDVASGRIAIITGPNASGKSVYVKQVALIVFLSHVGSYVPAESAVIGLCDRIFTRTAASDTTTDAESTFSRDVLCLSRMLHQAGPRSLCILDEFGNGTLTSDGIGLLGAVISKQASKAVPPKTLICTHFSELFCGNLLPLNGQVEIYTMRVLEGSNNADNDDSNVRQTFLYSLAKGLGTVGLGVDCAARSGVPHAITTRASRLRRLIASGTVIERWSYSTLQEKDKSFQRALTEMRGLSVEVGDPRAVLNDLLSKCWATDDKAQGQ